MDRDGVSVRFFFLKITNLSPGDEDRHFGELKKVDLLTRDENQFLSQHMT